MRAFTVSLPLPPSELHAHNTGHWRTKAAAVKRYRQMAHVAVIEKQLWPKFQRARVHYLFALPNRRRRDAANLLHSCKPAIDGIVDSGLIPDDCWEILEIGSVVCVVRSPSEVVLTFEEMECKS